MSVIRIMSYYTNSLNQDTYMYYTCYDIYLHTYIMVGWQSFRKTKMARVFRSLFGFWTECMGEGQEGKSFSWWFYVNHVNDTNNVDCLHCIFVGTLYFVGSRGVSWVLGLSMQLSTYCNITACVWRLAFKGQSLHLIRLCHTRQTISSIVRTSATRNTPDIGSAALWASLIGFRI